MDEAAEAAARSSRGGDQSCVAPSAAKRTGLPDRRRPGREVTSTGSASMAASRPRSCAISARSKGLTPEVSTTIAAGPDRRRAARSTAASRSAGEAACSTGTRMRPASLDLELTRRRRCRRRRGRQADPPAPCGPRAWRRRRSAGSGADDDRPLKRHVERLKPQRVASSAWLSAEGSGLPPREDASSISRRASRAGIS